MSVTAAAKGISESSLRLFQDVTKLHPTIATDGLRRLIFALSLGQMANLSFALSAIDRLRRNVVWLNSELATLIKTSELDQATSLILEAHDIANKTPPGVASSWTVATLLGQTQIPVADLDPLRAILLLVCLDRHIGASSVPSSAKTEDLAALIRSIDRGGQRKLNLRATAFGLRDAPDLSTTVAKFSTALAATDVAAADAFSARTWNAWVVGRSGIGTVTAPGSPPPSGGQPPRTDTPRPPPATVRRRVEARLRNERPRKTILPPVDPVTAPEPSDEAAAEIQYGTSRPSKPRKGRVNRSREEQRRLCFQAIRQRNFDLMPDHIEVLSQPEFEFVIPEVLKSFEAAFANGRDAEAGRAIAYGLVSALGRDDAIVGEIPLLARTPVDLPKDLELDLEAGEVRQPVFRPDNAATGAKDGLTDSQGFEPTQGWIGLPLPPRLLDAIRRLYARTPVAKLADWLPGESVQQGIRNMLGAIDGLGDMTRSIARARRKMAVQLLEESHDLASTMLLAGDTFGRSTAPLYYYTPRIADLRRIYRNAIWPCFGDIAGVDNEDVPGRIGGEVLVTRELATSGLRSLHKALDAASARARKANIASLIDFHNKLVGYVMLHFAFITTHRPTNALFEVGLHDLDLHHALAVLADKKVDAAHLARLAGLSKGLIRQFLALLSHLDSLANIRDIPTAAAEACRQAIRGEGPLFFFLHEDGSPLSGLEHYRATMPPEWHHLPDNWPRHYIATRLREAGAEPWLVMTQCGHLEGAGFPFSSESIVSPVQISKALQPSLEIIETDLDFRVRTGVGTKRPPGLVPVPPMRSWTADLKKLDLERRHVERNRLRAIAAQRRQNRESGHALAMQCLENVSPALHKVVQAMTATPVRTPDQATVSAATVNVDQTNEILELIDTAEVSEVIRLAARDRLARLLLRAGRKYEIEVPSLGTNFVMPGPEATPFSRGMALATRQILSLREEFRTSASSLRNEAPSLFKALTLVLFAGVTDEDELFSALNAPLGHELVQAGGPALLTKIMTAGGDISLGISGLAAVGARAAGGVQAATAVEISQALQRYFPTFFAASRRDSALNHLLQTASIASRTELSGCARFMASMDGSASAPYPLQRALLVNGPSTPARSATSTNAKLDANSAIQDDAPGDMMQSLSLDAEDAADDTASTDPFRQAEQARRQILKLCGTPPGAPEDSSRQATLAQVRQALQGLVEEHPKEGALQIEHALALFALEMAEHGTTNRDQPAPSTIRKYVAAVGRELIRKLAGTDLHTVDASELAEIYIGIIEGIPDVNVARTAARELLRMHDLLVRERGLEPVERSEFGEFLRSGERRIDANSVTGKEIDLALEWISSSIDQLAPDPLSGVMERRYLRMSRVILMMLKASGCRISEVALLRHADVLVIGRFVLLVIRRNIYRRIKTHSGRRILNLTGVLTDQEAIEIREWMTGERLRLGSEFSAGALVFPSLTSPRKRASASALGRILKEAFSCGAGRDAWPHLLRHHMAFSLLSKTLWDPARISEPTGWSRSNRAMRSVALRMGHSKVTTTVACYFHIPWAARAAECRMMSSCDERASLSAMSGLTIVNVDKLRQRYKATVHATTPALIWTDALVEHKARNLQPDQPGGLRPAILGSSRLSLMQLDNLLRAADRREAFHAVGGVQGLSGLQLEALEKRCGRLAEATGYRLLVSSDGDREIPRVRVPRRVTSHGLPDFLVRLDMTDQNDKIWLATIFVKCHRVRAATRENILVGPPGMISDLHEQLHALGISGLKSSMQPEKRGAPPSARLGLASAGQLSGFDQLRWCLAILCVATGVPEQHLIDGLWHRQPTGIRASG